MCNLTRKVLFEKFDAPDEIVTGEFFDYSFWRRKNSSVYKIIATKGNYKSIEFFNLNGVVHRDDDEPAYVTTYDGRAGEIRYYQNGKLHRGIFKPAVIHMNGKEEYYVFGEKRFETKVC